jgi:hypothetical protein
MYHLQKPIDFCSGHLRSLSVSDKQLLETHVNKERVGLNVILIHLIKTLIHQLKEKFCPFLDKIGTMDIVQNLSFNYNF